MCKSVYIHIPFCKTICSYCDFCKMYYKKEWVDAYLDALKEEILDRYLDDTIKTLYIGGGTPSSLSIGQIKKLLDICRLFSFEEGYEFTFECNLNDVTEEILYLLKMYHVNRLSLGIESFNEKNLVFLNRQHTFAEAEEKMKLIRKLGFDNVNVDLIYALPTEDEVILKKDLKAILKLEPDHISTYSLMIEPHTLLYKEKIEPIKEDIDAAMYKTIIKTLEKNGYIHYEISNYCKKGYESKHNLVYWNNLNYYGFGIGASSYIDNTRSDNTRSYSDYINGKYTKEEHILDINETISNEFILGFRKIDGINIDNFNSKYNINLLSLEVIKKLLKEKKLIIENDNIKINEKYLYVQNSILVEFLDLDYKNIKY